jgi:Gpi18-like mannosyltransferase
VKEKDKFITLLFILGFIIRVGLAPFTQDEFDLPYFRNVSLAYYLAGVNPLSVWTYGTAWLGTLLSFSSVGLVLQQLFLKSIYPPYILNVFIKLPSILADMLIPSFIYFYRRDLSISDTNIKRIITLWIFNPYTIFISSVWGQFDAIPTLLMLLSLIFFIKRGIFKSAILLGLGPLFKFFPILVLPLLCIALLKAKKVSHLVFYIIIAGIIMILQAIPYYFFAPHLLTNILGYRAGVGQWGDYYQGLTYLNLLWRYNLTRYLHPSPFLILYVISFGAMLLITLHRKSDVFNLTNPRNIFMLSLLSFIPFFLSYNMVNPQYIM